jgi:hypothetical protein
MLDRTAERVGLKPQSLAADSAYGSALAYLVKQRGIAPHIPVFDKSGRTTAPWRGPTSPSMPSRIARPVPLIQISSRLTG